MFQPAHASQTLTREISLASNRSRSSALALPDSIQELQTRSGHLKVRSSHEAGDRPDGVTTQVLGSTKQKGGKARRAIVRLGQRIRGAITVTDPRTPDPRDPFYYYRYDDYLLTNVRPGQQIEVQVNSRQFETGVELFNARTGKLLLKSYWRSAADNSSHIYFTPKAGVQYIVRVVPEKPLESGKYQLKVSRFRNPDPGFNFFYGNGLVDAAAATAQAIGRAPFAAVVDSGGDNWGLDMINAPEVWAQGFTGRGVTVAMIGVGVDTTHPDLQGNLWSNSREVANGIDDDGNGLVDDINGWNFVDNNHTLTDVSPEGNGTHSAGVIAAANNGFGTTGVAPDAKIMTIRVGRAEPGLNSNDRYNQQDVAKGIRYAVDNGAKVIHLGFYYEVGSTTIQPELESALVYARQSGAVVVTMAGNDRQYSSPNRPGEPGYFAAVRDLGIVVNGVDRNRAIYQSGNPAGLTRLDYVVAPGVDVRSTTPNATYKLSTGTGRASSYVAGVIALMLSANPNLTPTQVEQILTGTAKPQGIKTTP